MITSLMYRYKYSLILLYATIACAVFTGCNNDDTKSKESTPSFVLTNADTMLFNSFVDCNMAEAWIGDTFRIFSGKDGEDTGWGQTRGVSFSAGAHPAVPCSTNSRPVERLVLAHIATHPPPWPSSENL